MIFFRVGRNPFKELAFNITEIKILLRRMEFYFELK